MGRHLLLPGTAGNGAQQGPSLEQAELAGPPRSGEVAMRGQPGAGRGRQPVPSADARRTCLGGPGGGLLYPPELTVAEAVLRRLIDYFDFLGRKRSGCGGSPSSKVQRCLGKEMICRPSQRWLWYANPRTGWSVMA